MKALIFSALFGAVTAMAGSESAIPYNISCTGMAFANPETTVMLSTTRDTQFTLQRKTSIGDVNTFLVSQVSSRDGRLVLSSNATVYFAGGGTFTGTLDIPSGGGEGTWTEFVSVFDELNGQTSQATTQYDVSCVVAQ